MSEVPLHPRLVVLMIEVPVNPRLVVRTECRKSPPRDLCISL